MSVTLKNLFNEVFEKFSERNPLFQDRIPKSEAEFDELVDDIEKFLHDSELSNQKIKVFSGKTYLRRWQNEKHERISEINSTIRKSFNALAIYAGYKSLIHFTNYHSKKVHQLTSIGSMLLKKIQRFRKKNKAFENTYNWSNTLLIIIPLVLSFMLLIHKYKTPKTLISQENSIRSSQYNKPNLVTMPQVFQNIRAIVDTIVDGSEIQKIVISKESEDRLTVKLELKLSKLGESTNSMSNEAQNDKLKSLTTQSYGSDIFPVNLTSFQLSKKDSNSIYWPTASEISNNRMAFDRKAKAFNLKNDHISPTVQLKIFFVYDDSFQA